MTTLYPAVSDHHCNLIESLAREIWEEHYTPIIGKNQVEYMLDKFQSSAAIKNQINEGYSYFIIDYLGSHVGYISIKEESENLFLSKYYVLIELRGKGIGKSTMKFIEQYAVDHELKRIKLTVNKDNMNSVRAYEQLGFENNGSVIKDIGEGYVMDDYMMIKEL